MIEVIRDIGGYTTSRDYAKLWELAQKQSVVCVVDFDWRDGDVSRDVAHTIWNGRHLHVSCRGVSYADGDSLADFERSARRSNLEWLVPNPEAAELVRDMNSDVCALLDERNALLEALGNLLAIINDSRGAEGYHLNGDVAMWDEFPEVEAARAAIAKAKGGGA